MSGVPITIAGLPTVALAFTDQVPVWDQSAGLTGKFNFSALEALYTNTFALLTGAAFSGQVSVSVANNAVPGFLLLSGDYGAGSFGPFITLGANNNADGGGALIRFTRRGGANAHVWVDAALQVRVSTGLNGGAAGDVSGTVVGLQTSSLDQKDLAGDVIPLDELLAAIAQGAEAVHRFAYKPMGGYDEFGNEVEGERPYGGEIFEGVVVDYAPRYGTDRDQAHPGGKALNSITVTGDLLRAVAWLIEQNAEILGRLAALEELGAT